MAKNERKNTASPRRHVRRRGLDADRHRREDADREDLEADAAQRVHGAISDAVPESRRAPRQPRCPSAFAQASVASSAAPSGANISSISSSVMIIGGQKASVSPIARRDHPARQRARPPAAARPCPARRSPSRPAGASSIAAHQPERARLADQRVPGQPARGAPAKRGASAPHPRRRVHPLVDLQRLHPDRAGDRVPAVGVAVPEACRSARSSPRSPRPCRRRSPPRDSGRKPAGQLLGHGDRRRLEVRAPAPRTTRPVRPKPQITSSEIISTSCRRQTAPIASK